MSSGVRCPNPFQGVRARDVKRARVVVRGTEHAPDIDLTNRRDIRRLTPANVSWLQTMDGRWVACVHGPGGEFKALTLTLCRAVWPTLSPQDVQNNEVIVAAGVVRPAVPSIYAEIVSRGTKRSRKRRRGGSQATVQLSVLNGVNDASYNISARHNVDGGAVPPDDMFVARPQPAGGAALCALLRAQCRRAHQNIDAGPLAAITTAAALDAYPHKELLLQFYALMFGAGTA